MSSDENRQDDAELTEDLEVGDEAESVVGGRAISSDPEEGGQFA